MKEMLARTILVLARGHDAERAPLRHRLAGWVFRHFPGMITCGEFERFMLDYHEGSLPESQRREFETHMRLCGRCRHSLAGYRKAIAVGQRLFDDEMGPLPEEVPDSVVAAVVSAMNAPRN
ncbi:MAG: anti-sigma factor family protein [Minwuia sp.]|uniref:anti-sigma factor family protein n=1 Tax=Minwuia sp. TaxID=2493630 RepID=UPI003A8A8E10